MAGEEKKTRRVGLPFLRELPHNLVLSLLITALVGVADYITGWELSFGLFYLVPVGFTAWYQGRRNTMVVIGICSLTWMGVDYSSGHPYSTPMVPFWNTLVRLGFFSVVGFSLLMIRGLQLRQQDLVNYIVHDLRNPLTSILGNLELLKMESASRVDPSFREGVEDSLVAGERMKTLVNSILDLSRIENGKMEVEIRAVRVRELVKAAARDVLNYAKKRGVRVSLQIVDGIGTVHADRPLTERILVNLLTNAVKMAPPDSVVTVQADPYDQGQTLFSVTDQGPGIPKHYAVSVFDKFAQVKARGSGPATGTGLGLAFCKLAVELQGGRIWLESEGKAGTTVRFTLPAKEREDVKE